MTKTNSQDPAFQDRTSQDRVPLPWQRRIIAAWLLVVAAFVVATVIVGGATRLTESGLSITEWKPVTGVLPPLTQTQWQVEFEKYQQIPQYQQINRGMSLDEFKTIFWWEWAHRLLGRTIGAVFLLPFLFFLWRGWVGAGLRWRLWTLFALGGAQGAVGWWMVYSGLSDRVSVSQYRLAFHMTLACVIYALVLWTFLRLRDAGAIQASARLKAGAVALIVLVLAQIYLGALVAGIDAGLVYNTWPLIDGTFVPASDQLWFLSPAWRNIFENHLTVQFIHRMTAYALWIASLLHAWDALRARSAAAGSAMWLAIAVTVQAAIGILTLLHQVPFSLALTHQAALARHRAGRLRRQNGTGALSASLIPS
jgi:cytochrome c oxidase assembly protein subunit 15